MLSVVSWSIPLAIAIGYAMVQHQSASGDPLSMQKGRAHIGSQLFDTIVVLHLALWLIPFNGALALIVLTASQLFDSEKRTEWKAEPRLKAGFVAIWLVCLLAAALIPASAVEAPEQWGVALIQADENAPRWPATEQQVWLLDRGQATPVIVTVMHQRLPLTYTAWGTAEFAAWATEALDIDESRLSETARQLGVKQEHFELRDIESEGKHRYRSAAGDIDMDLTASRRQVITNFPFDGTVVSDLVTIYVPEWGGEMWAITITRTPAASAVDPWAEDIMLEWLSR